MPDDPQRAQPGKFARRVGCFGLGCGLTLLGPAILVLLMVLALVVFGFLRAVYESPTTNSAATESASASPTPTPLEHSQAEIDANRLLEQKLRPIFGRYFGRVETFCNGSTGPCSALVDFISNPQQAITDDDPPPSHGSLKGALLRSLEREMFDAYHAIFTSGLNMHDAVIQAHMRDEHDGWNGIVIYSTDMTNEQARRVKWQRKNLNVAKIWTVRVQLDQFLSD